MRPSQSVRPKASNPSHASLGDILFETFVGGGAGGAAIAFFFLGKDLLAGQALATPSLAGQVMFFGADPAQVSGLDITAVANMTALHIASFAAIGVIAALAVRSVRALDVPGFVPAALVLLALLELPALLASAVFFPGLGSAIGHGSILAANVIAATIMTLVLRTARRNGSVEAETDARERETSVPV